MKFDLLESVLPGVTPPLAHYSRLVNATYREALDEITPSILYGGRYNPKGEFGVLYLASSADCAYQEKLKQVHGDRAALMPQIVGVFNILLSHCLDLTSQVVLQHLGVSPADLVRQDDYATPQAIARQARKVGFEAILAPSAVSGQCVNLIVFKDRLVPPAYCVCDDTTIQPYP